MMSVFENVVKEFGVECVVINSWEIFIDFFILCGFYVEREVLNELGMFKC